MNYEEILNRLNKDYYTEYAIFQDSDTKELIVQCYYPDAYETIYGDLIEFYNCDVYEYSYSNELKNYLLKNLKNAY